MLTITELKEKLMGIRAALIDMDGTLYDSMPNHARAWKLMTEAEGLPAQEDEFYAYEGATGADMIEMLIMRTHGRHATDAEKKGLYAKKVEHFLQQPPVSLMPGAQDLIKTLQKAGIITVLVTGSGQSSLLNRLDEDFPGAFPPDRRITSASVTHGKPHPEPFLKGCALAGVDPSEAISFDNAPLGVKSAHDAHTLTVGVVTGPLDSRLLIDAGADFVFNSMTQCAKTFSELL